ncbi:trk system potassium uptake protein TrkA [Lachnospiraceae bacterium C7]|nr:trk system potassium uptake protein TrkA [Lachnospiraceae bacterium C7]
MNKSIAILGMGQFGSYIAEELSDNGADVLIADKNEEIINQYADKVSYAMTAELSDPKAIEAIGLSNMDVVVVAMGDSLESSIMCVMVAKEEGVPYVIAKASSERMGEILKKVGADEVIYAEKESARSNARKIMSSNFLEFFDLGDDLCVVSMRPLSRWVGKTLSELRLRNKYKINVVAVKKNKSANADINPEDPIEADSQLLIITQKNNLDKLNK